MDKFTQGGRAANKEAAGRYLGALAQRKKATNILNPTEVAGEYDAGRLLATTLGGQIRAITQADLQTFRQNVKQLGKKFHGGITAKSVIDLSLPADRERANKQIRSAVPVQSLGGRMHFLTNAGPESKVTRHHVHIELLNYSASLSTPGKAADMVRLLTAGALKFDCDCERHRYLYRYIATVGKYNAGVVETGFPKITNPRLVGVACKHALRVMQALSHPTIKVQIEKMVEDGRASLDSKVRVLTKKQVKEIADQQAKTVDWKRSQIETTSEKANRLALARARAVKAETAITSRSVGVVSERKLTPSEKAIEEAAARLVVLGALTKKQYAAIISKL